MAANKLAGKVAVVTGGASGIGLAAARAFVAHGARAVVIADVRADEGRAAALSVGPDVCSFFRCDVADEDQVRSLVDHTAATHGGLDVFFINAGVVSDSEQTVLNLDLDKYEAVMRVNARGTAVCLKHAARKMVELGCVGGAIVCNASVMGDRGAEVHTDYGTSKHAVVGLARSAAVQLGRHGIRVNCVSPAAVPTALAGRMGLGTAEEVEAAMGPYTSLKGAVLTPKHVAEAVAFLASGEAGFVTGHNLVVDGGLTGLPSGE
ncbi:NAD(P)-binding Rossmann-fold superfamily protein [Striga asiatica]|uniref:NAD(P)-binding Rossmann-fold superfamily protein n=1 Tax=Striga asiatica TaxID=4170 RepID=A0A5A7Q094_STRAF|nr:NAD(P)-binding Rossmann-fold superfamily protein [Striga asiatica]